MKITFYCETCKETEVHKNIPMCKADDALVELVIIGFNFAQKHERHKVKAITNTPSCWEKIV